MSTVNGTDEVLVNRNNETYTQPQSTLMAKLEKTDLLLVNRNDQTYTVTGEDFIESVVDPISLEVTFNPTKPVLDQQIEANAVISGGKAPEAGYVYTYQWYIADDDSGTNAAELAGETNKGYTPLASQLDKYLGCKITTTDFFGDAIEDTSYTGPVSSIQIAPEISSVTLTEDFDGANRYTSKDFPFATAMTTDGSPEPDYGLQVKLTGTTFDFNVMSDKINDVGAAGTQTYETSTITKVEGGGLYNEAVEAAWTGYTGPAWATSESWSGLSASSDFGNNSGSQGYGTPMLITTPHTVVVGDFGSKNRGAKGWALKFPRVVTLTVTPPYANDLVRIQTTQNLTDTLLSATNYPATGASKQDPLEVTGQVFWFEFTGHAAISSLGLLEGANNTLTFTNNTNFDKFADGDVVQDPGGANEVKIVGTPNSTTNKITVDGGNWYADPTNGGDGSGTVGGTTEFTKTVSYNAKVTLDSDQDLSQLNGQAVHMTTAADPSTKDGYTLTTSTITDIAEVDNWNKGNWLGVTSLTAGQVFPNSIPGMFNGVVDGVTVNTTDACNNYSTSTATLTTNLPVEAGKSITIWGYISSSSSGQNIRLNFNNGSAVSWNHPDVSSTSTLQPAQTVPDGATAITSIVLTGAGNSGAGIAGIVHDGQLFVDNSVPGSSPNINYQLTFADPCPDLRYFEKDDVVQGAGTADEVKVVNINTTDNTMTVDGGNWDVSDQSQVWSINGDNTQLSSGTRWSSAFDGKLKTNGWSGAVLNGNNLTATIELPVEISGEISFYASTATGIPTEGQGIRFLNASDGLITDVPFSNAASSPQWFDAGTLANVKKIQLYTGGNSQASIGFQAVRLNGKILVDKVLNNRTWSSTDYFNNNGAAYHTPDRNIEQVFNGEIATSSAGMCLPAAGGTFELNFNVPEFLNVSKVEFQYVARGSGFVFSVNGVDRTGDLGPLNNSDVVRYVEFSLSTFNKVEWSQKDASNFCYLGYIKVDGQLLVDSGIDRGFGDAKVEYQTTGGEGTIVKVDGNDAYITNTGDDLSRWIADDNAAGTSFYIVPQTPISDSVATAYGAINQSNGDISVTGIQKNKPEFTSITTKDGIIKFPAEFIGTGNPPDIDLPDGVAITATVQAKNILSDDEQDSNTLLPQAPNPDGVAGPITATTSTTLTVANSVNLDTFSPGDNLVMVDENNDISSYTIVSDSIVSVDSTTYDYTSYWTGTVIGKSGTTADAGMAFDDNVVSNYVYGNANQTITWTPPEPISYEDIKLYVSQSGYGGTVVVNNIDVTSAIQVYTGTTGVFFSKVQLEGLGVTSPLTSIAITSSSAQGNTPIMCGLEIDGRLLIDNDVQTTLTLASDQDLAYFRPGDAVQSTKEWNQDQVWSAAANYTGNVVSPEVAFNGLADSNPFGGTKASSGLVTWRPPSPVSFNTIKIIGWANSDAQGLQINDTLVMGVDASGISYKTLENDDLVAKGITSPLKSISFAIAGGVGSGFYAVYLDGKLLVDEGIAGDPGSEVKVISIDETVPSITVDGGEWAGTDGSGDPGWNQDQVWSDDVINDRAGYPATNAFDGSLSTVAYADAGKTTTVTFASAIPVDKLRINVSKSGAGTTGIVLNGTNYVAEQIGGNGWNTITGVTFLESISYTSTSNNDFIGIYQIEVNGKLLVDQGVAGAPTAGDTEVTTAPVTGTGVFASTNGTDEITLSTSNDRWIDNNNRLSKNFYVRDNITVLNADNPKHVAMQQAIADAFTAFPQKVNERRTSIASSFYRLMAGEAVSAAELQLLEDTVTDAVNAQEPFALDGYYPLYYTSEKADAASSVNAHHTHTINGIEYYMPDGGTLYHGTYTS